MRNSRGVSLVALTITIIAIIIISAIVVRVGTSGIDLSIETRISNEKKEVESAIISRFADYLVNEDKNPLIGQEVSAEEIAGIEGINNNNIDYIRKVNEGDIQRLSFGNTTGSSYIVDYMAGKVFGPLN